MVTTASFVEGQVESDSAHRGVVALLQRDPTRLPGHNNHFIPGAPGRDAGTENGQANGVVPQQMRQREHFLESLDESLRRLERAPIRLRSDNVVPGRYGFMDYDETCASISVVLKDNTKLQDLVQGCGYVISEAGPLTQEEILAGSVSTSDTFTDFLLTDVTETRVEKSHVAATFGEAWVFFFGEQPLVLQCRGVLANTANYPWLAEFIYNYENYFRGTKLLEMGAKAYLSIENDVFEGYMMNFTYHKSSEVDRRVPFSFAFYVTKISRSVVMAVEGEPAEEVILKGEVLGIRDETLEKDPKAKTRKVADALLKSAWDSFADPKKLIKAAQSGDWQSYLMGGVFGVGRTIGGMLRYGEWSGSRVLSDIQYMISGGKGAVMSLASSFGGQMGLTHEGFRDEFRSAVIHGEVRPVKEWIGPSSHSYNPKVT